MEDKVRTLVAFIGVFNVVVFICMVICLIWIRESLYVKIIGTNAIIHLVCLFIDKFIDSK